VPSLSHCTICSLPKTIVTHFIFQVFQLRLI
jgi:hypothetical protein